MSRKIKKLAAPEGVEEVANEEVVSEQADVAEQDNAADNGGEEQEQEQEQEAAVAPAPAPVVGHNSEEALQRDFRKLLSDVGTLGRDNGSGKKAQVALAERVTKASADGICDASDAEKIYKRFREHSAKSSTFDSNLPPADMEPGSMAAQISKLKRFIEMGKGLYDDAWPVLERARDMHIQAMATEDKKSLREKGTYQALISVAREQLKEEHKGIPLTEEQIAGVIFKEDSNKETTGLDLVRRALKEIENARDGRKATESRAARDPVEHESLGEAREHLRQVLIDLDPDFLAEERKTEAEAQARISEQAAAAGFQVVGFTRA